MPTSAHERATHSEAPHEHEHEDHEKHAGHSPEMFRDRLWFSLALTVPILYFSPQIQDWFGFEAASFGGDYWVSPLLATALYSYAGRVFLLGAVREVRARRPGMMILIALAISVAYGYSIAVSAGLDGKPFYWELATLLDVMLLGHWMEMRSVVAASSALKSLAALVPHTAHALRADGGVHDVEVASLVSGDLILVRPGEQVPVDGLITDGASTLNESFLTGESRPVPKGVDDPVVAGAINGEGAITVRVTSTGEATALSQIMRLVAEAQGSRSEFQALADRAAMWLTIVAVSVSIPTFVAWSVLGSSGLTFAVARSVTVLVIACPHALGLAIPLVTTNATALAARTGILVRNREAFERGRDVSILALDKTGTLTEGRFVVSRIVTRRDLEESEVAAMAGALERSSEHPLARAIVEAAEARGGSFPPVRDIAAVPGFGVRGSVGDEVVHVGRPEWAEEVGPALSEPLAEALATAHARGETAVVVFSPQEAMAVISLADKVRDTSRAAMSSLRDMGIEPVMITGDAAAVAVGVAAELGIERYFAEVLPQEKAAIVARLKDDGVTAFVGDGINDAPALLEAHMGMAIGAGTEVAIESADLVLIDDDPMDAVAALRLSRLTSRRMRQNLGWATGYNVIALPLAAGVGSGFGIVLEPAVGGLLMSLSTVIVAINAMLLRRVDPRGEAHG